MISVAERAIYDEIAAGRLPSFKLGKRRLIRVEDLTAFIERRALLANPPSTPRLRVQADGSSVLPFPDMGTGVETDRAASSAAGRGRTARKKKAALSGN